jgi:hypothetical protein
LRKDVRFVESGHVPRFDLRASEVAVSDRDTDAVRRSESNVHPLADLDELADDVAIASAICHGVATSGQRRDDDQVRCTHAPMHSKGWAIAVGECYLNNRVTDRQTLRRGARSMREVRLRMSVRSAVRDA